MINETEEPPPLLSAMYWADPHHGTVLCFSSPSLVHMIDRPTQAGKVQTSSLDGSRVCDVASGLPSPYGLALGKSLLCCCTDRMW